MVEPKERSVSAIQELGRTTRLETEDEGCMRERLVCPEFCWARGDCGRDVLGPRFAAPQGALKVPIKDEGSTAGDPGWEAALVLKQGFSCKQHRAKGQKAYFLRAATVLAFEVQDRFFSIASLYKTRWTPVLRAERSIGEPMSIAGGRSTFRRLAAAL